jgi:hypothetical protein
MINNMRKPFMKKTKLLLVGVVMTILSTASLAAKDNGTVGKKLVSHPGGVFLYSQHDKKSQYKSFALARWQYARPFYRKHDWLKVAFTDNGATGWVNTHQLEKAFIKQQQADTNIQTVYVNRTTGKHGKPVVNIVAYKNGAKLTNEEARKMYQKMRVNGIKQQEYFNQMNLRLHNIMNHDFGIRDPFFNVSYSHDYDNWYWPNF